MASDANDSAWSISPGPDTGSNLSMPPRQWYYWCYHHDFSSWGAYDRPLSNSTSEAGYVRSKTTLGY